MQPDLPGTLFDLMIWDQLSEQACKQLAQHVAAYLPAPFRFTSLDTYETCARFRHVAFFTWQADAEQPPRRFSLIPGGSVTLGFDRAHPFAVERDLVIDWQQYCVKCQVDVATLDKALVESEPYAAQYEAFYDYLARVLHPFRKVTLRPFLVETAAELAAGAKRLRRQAEVVARLKQEGFRLLTVDEWEYVCAAGSRTLFAEHFLDEEDSLGSFDEDKEDFAYQWADDQTVYDMTKVWEKLRNAFGLSIATDRSRWEYCADPTLMKGGDGNKLIGYDIGLLSLAPAYFHPLSEREISSGVSHAHFRRVYDLIREVNSTLGN